MSAIYAVISGASAGDRPTSPDVVQTVPAHPTVWVCGFSDRAAFDAWRDTADAAGLEIEDFADEDGVDRIDAQASGLTPTARALAIAAVRTSAKSSGIP